MHAGELLVAPELRQDFSPVQGRHYDVEHDDVGAKLVSDFDSLGGVVDRDHVVVVGTLEEPDEDSGHGLVVVDDQDALLLHQVVPAAGVALGAMRNPCPDEVNACRQSTCLDLVQP